MVTVTYLEVVLGLVVLELYVEALLYPHLHLDRIVHLRVGGQRVYSYEKQGYGVNTDVSNPDMLSLLVYPHDLDQDAKILA